MFRKVLVFFLLTIGCSFSLITRAAESMSPEELVSKHLNAIGSKEALSNAKSRAVTGQVEYRILSGGRGGFLDGSSTLLTEGHKLLLYIKLPNNEYRGERFIFDGEKIEIRPATARQQRSLLGEFLHTQDVIIREGLLGGVLSTAWPLLELDERKPKLSYDGMKTVDGQKLLELRYQPRKNTDLNIHLYFDPDSFRHVRTVYTLTVHPSFVAGARGASETGNARQTESQSRLDEKFSDFKTAEGLTLPTHYVLQYSEELQIRAGGGTVVSAWDTKDAAFQQNVSPDPRNFQVH